MKMDKWAFLYAEAQPARFMDGYRAPLLVLIIAALITGFLTPIVRRFALKKGAVDDPTRDPRRVHKKPIPKWGGLALYAGIVISLCVVLPFAYPKNPFHPYLLSIFFVGFLIVIMGMVDDIYHLPARYQVLFLLGAGFLAQYLVLPGDHLQITGIEFPLLGKPGDPEEWISFGIFSWPITAIYIFVVTKIMDTIDGLDGLAAGIAAIAGATLSVIGTFGGQPRVALVAAAIAGAAMGFLRYNFNPAKIFMGTAGSQVLGFMLACISIVGAFKTATAVSIGIPILVFGVPFFDALFVIVRRILSRVPITQADKRHIHHTLISYGFSQRQAVSILYLTSISLCIMILLMIISIYK
jgi:UDP-GlcNAc:undecaprenyl-phosphate GlcNAc-1-phosphate transferase